MDMTDPVRDHVFRMVLRHRGDVLATILVMVGELEIAEDLLQDTLLAILNAPSTWDPTRPFVPWARGIARNHVRRHWERQGRRTPEGIAALETMADAADEGPCERPEMDRLRRCLKRLPERSRQLLRLRYDEGCSDDDLALRSGLVIGSLRNTLARIRMSLRQCVEGLA